MRSAICRASSAAIRRRCPHCWRSQARTARCASRACRSMSAPRRADRRCTSQAIGVCASSCGAAASAAHALGVLDIGGGFPVDYCTPAMPIEEFCAPIRAALAGSAPGSGSSPNRAATSRRRPPWRSHPSWGARCARALVVLPRRRLVRLVQRPASSTTRAIRSRHWWRPGRASVGARRADLRQHRHHREDLSCRSRGSATVVGRAMGAYTWATATEFNFFPRRPCCALDRGRLLRGLDA